MRFIARIGMWGGAAMLALAVAGAPAVATPKPIRGKLTKPGYAVLALADNGELTVVVPGTKRFRLTPPAERISLHVRARDGTYAGPVVVAKRGKRAIVGVKAGARLGTVRVKAAKGYAKPTKKLAARWLDAQRRARAKRGVPIGAGSFGHVRSPSGRAAVHGDADRDGIPNALDVDDDGDLVLDALDDAPAPRSRARSSQGPLPGNPCAPNPFCVHTNLFVPATATTNSHVGSNDEAIEQTLQRFGTLRIVLLPGGPVELDCGGELNLFPPPARIGGFRYCSSDGTGMASQSGGPDVAFPNCCDNEDRDGFGTMFVSGPPPGPGASMGIKNFRSDQIVTGNPLIQHIATGGDVGQCPPAEGSPSLSCASWTSAVSFVFAAPPALGSYTPEGGSSTSVQYPITGPLTVRDGDGDGDIEVTLSLFRPQRRPTPEEPGHGQAGAWMDLGGLAYGVPVDFVTGTPGTGASCPQDAFSEDDDELGPRPAGPSTPSGLVDTAPDRPASSADTFTFTLNITRCLGGAAWAPGNDVGLSFRASKAGSLTDQSGVIFRRGS